MNLVDSLISENWLKTKEIIEAFKKIKRVDFLPEPLKEFAESNEAFPIGEGQTISQPLVVALMLELLEPKQGERIMDIGSGSGYTTALLSEIVGDKGKIVSIERIPELFNFGKANVSKYSFIEKGIVEYVLGDGSKGFEKYSPYDKILISAASEKLEEPWKKQLKLGGRVVLPIHSSIYLFIKKGDNIFEQKEYPGFSFVPLIK